MYSSLLFDFNNVLLFVEESAIAKVANKYQKISVPNSHSKFFYLNTELLDFIKEKKSQLTTAILTASEYSLYQPEIKSQVMSYFDYLFFAKDRGWSKDLPATYLATAQELNTAPDGILFIDDKYENVIAAKNAGLHVHHFSQNSYLFAEFKS